MYFFKLTNAVVACLFFLLAGALPSRAADPIRVMLLDGESGGPYHAWQLTTPVIKKELEDRSLSGGRCHCSQIGRRL